MIKLKVQLKSMLDVVIDAWGTVLWEWRLRTDRAVRATVDDWCMRELAPWIVDDNIAAYEQALQALNASEPWTFLFSVGPHGATVIPEPAHIDIAGELAWRRVQHYLAFLARVAPPVRLRKPLTLAIDLNDRPASSHTVPVFSFQKTTGSHNILVPDIDFLLTSNSSLPSWSTFDRIPWRHKRNSAVFAGSTTGGVITADVVRNCSLPRLRAALSFRDKLDVVYRLPYIVDCDTPETEAMLRDRGFGEPALPWQQQFQHRFIISMDGNGATCSRVAITLRSQSVLLKYKSDWQLYYFHELKPWQHYVPIAEDDDVLRTVALSDERSKSFKQISAAGRRFARTFLTRRAVDYYMATRLEHYARMLGHPAETALDRLRPWSTSALADLVRSISVSFGLERPTCRSMRHAAARLLRRWTGLPVHPFARRLRQHAIIPMVAVFAAAAPRATAPETAAPIYDVKKPMTLAYGPLAVEQGELYMPAVLFGRVPGVVMIHGGGLMGGSRQTDSGLAQVVASRGLMVFNIDYRLATVGHPDTRWPAQLVDAQLAVRFLRSHANEYNVDPARIGAIGDSSGAQLAVLLGAVSRIMPGDEAGLYPKQQANVGAVVDQFGPMDLVGMKLEANQYQALFGTDTPTIDMLKSASPLPFISSRTAPIYILHGEKDQVVPFQQSRQLAAALRAHGVRPVLVPFLGGHGYADVPLDEIGKLQIDAIKWLVATLKQ